MQRVRVLFWLLLCFWVSPIACDAQEPIIKAQQPQGETTPVAKTIDLKVGEVLRVAVPKLPPNPTGKIAVFLGDTDITSQVEIQGNEIVYRSSLVPLPIGEQTLTVYSTLITDFWDTLATFRIKVAPAIAGVPTPPSTETSPSPTPGNTPPSSTAQTPTPGNTPPPSSTDKPVTPGNTPPPSSTDKPVTPGETPTDKKAAEAAGPFVPKLTFNLKSQLFDSRTADAASLPRPPFLSVNFTGGLATENQIDKTKVKTKFTVIGATFQPDTFQFKELQGRAPQFDLSEYAIETNDGNNQFSVGHLCFGNHPFLLSNLCTRGISAKVKLNEFSDLSAAQISSTGIVGFDNILGIGQSENRLDSMVLGFQVAQNQASGVRLETTWMNGSRAPIASFNVGEVADAEQSEGVGIRLVGGDDTGRLKADAGFANSTFTNPAPRDPQLTGGATVVPLQSATKSAWYAEASYDLLKNIPIEKDRTLSASINVRTERIDPQFGTLGATLQADRLQTQYALNLDIAGATAQFQQNFSEDNLSRIPTLLTTNNRNTNINLTFPLQAFLKNQSPFLPTISYGLQQTQQNGSIVAAAGGGFNNTSQIPNQFNTTNKVGLDWKIGDWTLNYKYTTAFQDNRQVGRENADTRNITHLISTDWQVNPQLRLNLGYNFVNANNTEQGITRLTNSPTLGLSWEFMPSLLFAFNYNHSEDSDTIGQAFNRAESLGLLLTWNFKLNSLGREFPGSTFLRYDKGITLNRNAPNINTNATIESISTGLSLSF
jgi:hypothetical protein